MKPLDIATLKLSGLNLVEASAGTGKTWTIAALYVLLLLEKELRPEQILVVTYTKAATTELRARIRHRIADTLDLYTGRRPAADDILEQLLMTGRPYDSARARLILARALYSFDDAAIFTIHGFCQRALLENTFESGSLFGCDLISDQSTIVKQVYDDFWRNRILSQPDDIIERYSAAGYTPEKLAKPLEGHFQNPDLVIIPHPEATPLAPLSAERNRLCATICSLWGCDRTAILEQLEQAGLNQQSYKPAQIDAAARSLDIWTACSSSAVPVKDLELFSIQRIISKTTKSSQFTPAHPFFSLCQQTVEVMKSLEQAFKNRIIASQHELKQWLEQELPKRKAELNQRSFDDLLLDLNSALEAESGPALADKLRKRYQAVMIDEFQDTDPLQWNIFQKISAQQDYPLFLIGDPKQAIYSFRGADVFAYLSAARSIPQGQTQTLATNFRSDKYLVNAVNTLFSATEDPFMSREIPFHPVQPGRQELNRLLLDGVRDETPFRLWILPRNGELKPIPKPAASRTIVHSVAAEISRLLEPGRAAIRMSGPVRPLQPHDIAVLVKSHHQADQIQGALQSLGIPSAQLGNSTIFETAEALDFVRILRAVAEPHREILVREALLTASMGLSANQLSRYVERAGEDPAWETWLVRFRNLHAAAESGGIVAVVSRLLGSCGVRERVLLRSGGERCLTNLLHCCEMLHEVEREQGKSITGLITWLERKISTPRSEDSALLRLETDDNAVIISTIHASKGLQYPVVFVPFSWDAPASTTGRALFHNDQGSLLLDLANEEASRKRAAAEQKAEAARLLYVALTRAEFRCYAVWGAINGAGDSPLFNLLHAKSAANDVKRISALSDQETVDEIRRVTGDGDSGIRVELLPVDTPACPYHADDTSAAPYACRILHNPPRDDWRVASFSGMTSGSGHPFEPHDHDPLPLEASAASPVTGYDASNGLTLFDFPRGAKAGTCLHELFEQLDFSRLDNTSVYTAAQAALAENGFSNQWLPAVQSMVTSVTNARIVPNEPDFTLGHLHEGEWHTEMEFYLPVRQLTPAILQSVFEGILDTKLFSEYYELLNKLSFRQSRGMLQGFIDLVFSYGGRFYILDWKSNHLGMKTADYSREAMHESMCRSAYILQYHLYTLALDRLLKVRLPGYSYDTHFGGVSYVYLRGITGELPMNGIYFDRPSPEFIRRSTELILD